MQAQDIPYGYCYCGCGRKTRTAKYSCAEKGWTAGEPLRYINGHNRRKHTYEYRVEGRGYETPCWIWLGSKTWNGYGQGKYRGKQILGHVFWYERLVGPVPEGKALDHLCRQRDCCNPEHVEPVTYAENARRGRATKLTVEKVREIKRAPRSRGSVATLAARYGVSTHTIEAIRAGRLWGDVMP